MEFKKTGASREEVAHSPGERGGSVALLPHGEDVALP